MMINRRVLVLPALIALAGHHAQAFTPSTFGRTGNAASSIGRFSMVADVEVDVSVDYDSAARLAYDQWCKKFGKEASDARFENFKANYEALTVANVSAAKKARDTGAARPSDLELNEYGDMTEVEAMKAMGVDSSSVEEAAAPVEVSADVSIDYDSAARLAYDQWCKKYGKTASDAKFAVFKANYEAISVANVSAAKKARDEGVDRPKDLELNEFGDMTEAEYMAMQSGGAPAAETEKAPEKGPLETVMEASAAQSEASSALAEAADALAEEEKKLAEQLGMDSIEELENAIDAMEGIDTDGGEIDTSDVREARVRSAYLDWCKEYGKQPDESRFPTFSSNFLAMEEYAKENGREMVLNKYADCTEDEYRNLTQAPAPVVEEPVVEQKIEVDTKVVEKKAEEPKAEAPAPKVEVKAAPAAEKPKEPEAKAAPKPPAAKPKPKPEPVKELSLEEQAIADAKAVAEKEAAQIAKRRALDEAAAEMERQKAKEALEKQQQLMASRAAAVPKPPVPEPVKKAEPVAVKVEPVVKKPEPPAAKPEKKEEAGIFASIFGSPAKPAEKKAPVKPAVPVEPAAPVAAKEEKKAEAKKVAPASPFAGLFQPAAKPEPKAEPAAPKAVAPKAAAPEKSVDEINMAPNAMTEALNSFFGNSQSTPATPPEPTPEPEPVVEKKSTPAAFNFFGGSLAPKKEAPVAPKPAPVPVRKPTPTLSLFNTAPKPAPKPKAETPAPVSKPAPKGSGTFSLFSSPPAPKPAPVPAPVVEKKKPAPSFGFFGAAPKPAPTPAPEPVAEKKPVQGSGTFSLFGGAAPKPAPVEAPVVEKKPAPKTSSAFGFFSAPPKKATPPQAAAPKKSAPVRGPGTFSISSATPKQDTPAPKPAQKSPTFSLFGGSKPSVPAPTPAPAAPKPAPKKTPSFSLAGRAAQPKKAAPKKAAVAPKKAVVAPKKAPVTPKKPAQKSPTFNIFGGASPAKKPEPTPAPEPVKPKAAAKPSFGFSFGGGATKAAAPKVQAPVADNIPIVSKFTQNADGSITGIVRNSKNFRNGTEITTSPVRRGAKSGDVVTTSSGSKYRLE